MTFFRKNFLCIALLLATDTTLTLVTEQRSTKAQTFTEEREVKNFKSISQYDLLSQTICQETAWDWKFLLAIAHTESRFNADIKSHRGATGLMQIMPRTAKYLGYENADLTDPKISFEVAISVLDAISSTLRFPESMSTEQRLSIILASYNAGIGYVVESRKMAHGDGAAYNDWHTLKSYITRNGTHKETIGYVEKVMKTYNYYQSI